MCLTPVSLERWNGDQGQYMETKHWIVPAPAERLPALFLAVVATLLVFAAINAGFAADGADQAGGEWHQASGSMASRA